MEKNRGRINIRVIIVAAAIVALIAFAAATFFIARYTPTKEKMSGYSYFGLSEDEQKTLVIVDGQMYESIGEYVDGRLYIPASFIEDNINVRFYYDSESGGIMYSDTAHVYTYVPGETEYTDEDGVGYSSEYNVAAEIDGVCYAAWEYVAERTDCSYEYGGEPSRLVVTLSHDEQICVTAEKKLAVRYRGGIKSPVLETVEKGTRLVFNEDYDDWVSVTTPTGITGYVKKSQISDQYSYIPENTFEQEYSANLMDENVCLGWFQVSGTAGNSYIEDCLSDDAGINVISPTWYSISSESGSVTSYASTSFVSKMHSQGIDVWALVDDFDDDIDYKALFSRRSARETLIDRLISDAGTYGFDGINLDFENVNSEYSKDFLQFVRELSVECEKAGLVLSTDNYKPEAYNACYNLKEQSAFVDYVIVMAYDEHYAGSDAGSVASLPFVTEAVQDTMALVPKEQVVVGIPFYTRIWTTTGQETTSKAVAMQTALDQLTSDGQVALWNDECGQYVASYSVGNSTRQIWFEEEKSIEAKMQVIQSNEAAGVACWKLGLEKSAVWAIIDKYN